MDTTEESFCVYCQKQYASPANLRRHVAGKHPGSTRDWAYRDDEMLRFLHQQEEEERLC